MTLIDAIRSGHEFKRRDMLNWLFVGDNGVVRIRQGGRSYIYKLRVDDALASDWEVKQ